jgi:Ser/Thr protein kinase RdoA (MazF antagonist)
MTDHPARARWARPGGVAELVAWADQHLTRSGEPQQLRTWNLSLVVRLPTTTGWAWLKAVPPFMAHEGAVIEAVGSIGPRLLARADGVVLLDDVPGEDQYDAPAGVCAEMVRRWVKVQSTSPIGLVPGLPDWRPASFIPMIDRLVDRPELEALVADLPRRFDALDGCGLPDTLVHGDFHAGNWRGDTLLDWGDSGIGHPLLDQPAFLHGNLMDDEKRTAARVAWRDAWHDARPGSDPDRAAELIAPIAALRAAHIFRVFLDNIEPDEHCYHRHDTEDWLQRAIALAT